ncbi:helix-turn-helix transcriptional regulator [Streptosporangium sp. NPDC049078]|uniref:helix-turn-helix domain-containing protein n=1 Tax=Streptosporangium sp. NPDC049078 TaxID=3155767 RepID=UPI003444A811
MLTLTIPQRLRQFREDRDLFQEHIAAELGVCVNTLSRWERGVGSPRVHHIAAYARLVDKRLVIRRGQVVICDALDALPHLGELRRRAGVSLAVVRERIHCTPSTLESRERQMRRGGVRLTTLQPYLAALGYTLDLIPAAPAEQVAA